MANVPFTMVTGASSGYYHGLTNFVGGLHYWCPKCRLAIYDLGLDQNQIQTIKDSWCGVKIIKAPGGSNALHTYAWKPQAIADAVERFGVILWLDAGCALTGPLDGVEAQIRRDGVWNVQGQDGGMIPYVHPGTFKWFNVSKDLFEGRYSFAGGIWGFVRGSPYVDAILRPWAACAKDPACIMPPGSSLSNHRYDQAAVSIITYMVSDTLNYDGTLMWPRICPADRNGGKCPPPHGLKTQPHTDVLAANAGQLNGGGCYQASKMVIWTARQACGCYARMVSNCTGVAPAPERLPDSTAPLDLEI